MAGQALLEMLNRMGCGGVLLDRSGTVLDLNPVAQHSLSQNGSGCGFSGKVNTDRVTRSLHQFLGCTRQDVLSQAPRVVLNGGERPLIARALNLPGLAEEGVEALLILLDLDACAQPSEEVLQRAFGLTKCETKLALRLACGENLQDIADEFGITIGTARVQLKVIFSKTNTSRQAELVALLVRLRLVS